MSDGIFIPTDDDLKHMISEEGKLLLNRFVKTNFCYCVNLIKHCFTKQWNNKESVCLLVCVYNANMSSTSLSRDGKPFYVHMQQYQF